MDIFDGKLSKSFVALLALALTIGAVAVHLHFFQARPVRIGYFDGVRVNMFYRTYINGFFEQEGVKVKLYSKFLGDKGIFEVSKTYRETLEVRQAPSRLGTGRVPGFGKISGTEIVDKMMVGELDGGTIGESSFVASVGNGAPIVAVAMLGYESVPGKAIVMRNNVPVEGPQDLMGKTLASRRAGPGDAIFIREFLEAEGLTPEDVTIVDQVDEKDIKERFLNGTIDGGLFHIFSVKHLLEDEEGYIYRPMDWIEPPISHALLVFRKDYVDNHREEVQKVVNAYTKRIAYEKALPEEKKDRSWNKMLAMEGKFRGLRIASYEFPPLVRIDVLEHAQDLLFKYNEIDRKVDMNEFIDNSFAERFL